MGKTYKDSKHGKKPVFPRRHVDWDTGTKIHTPKPQRKPKYREDWEDEWEQEQVWEDES